MSDFFLESSALAKRYKREERGCGFVNKLFKEGGGHNLFYLNLTIVEIRKIFFRLYKYPQQEDDTQISTEEFKALQSRFAADLLEMRRLVITEEMINFTSEILQKKWVKNVFDLLQLSGFLVAKKEYLNLKLVSAASDINKAAKEFVLESDILNPEDYE